MYLKGTAEYMTEERLKSVGGDENPLFYHFKTRSLCFCLPPVINSDTC